MIGDFERTPIKQKNNLEIRKKMVKKSNKMWLVIGVIILALFVLNSQGLLDSRQAIIINDLSPLSDSEISSLDLPTQDSGRSYSAGGAICSLAADEVIEFSATSSNDARACYTNDNHIGVRFDLDSVPYNPVGPTKALINGQEGCFSVTSGQDYIAHIYYCDSNPEDVVCSDSDGGKIYDIKGHIQVDDSLFYDDYCQDSTTLVERFCDPNEANLNQMISCEDVSGPGSVCYEGRCYSASESHTTIQCVTCKGDVKTPETVAITIGTEFDNCLDFAGYFPTDADISCNSNLVQTDTGAGTSFQPILSNMWVESEPGNNDWTLLTKGSSIPTSITSKWSSGEEINVIIEVDNSGAKNYNSAAANKWWNKIAIAIASNVEYDSRNIAAQLSKWINERRIDYYPEVGYVWDLEKESDEQMFIKENIELVNAIPFINFALMEVSFLNPDNDIYNYPRFANLEDIIPVSKRDACLGSEEEEEWIDSYALLLMPPVDGLCWDFNNIPRVNTINLFGWAYSANFKPEDYNGFCKYRVKTTVKVPEIGNTIASGADNYNTEGKYNLQSSVFEKCYHPVFGVPEYLSSYYVQATVPVTSSYDVCCRTGHWWNSRGYDYFHTKYVDCVDNQNGEAMDDQASIDKCYEGDEDFQEYYKCDVLDQPSFHNYTDEDNFDRILWKEIPDGGYNEVYRICGVEKIINPKWCESCAGELIQIEETNSCPKRPLATTDYFETQDELNQFCVNRVNCYTCAQNNSFIETSVVLTGNAESSCHELRYLTYQEKTADPFYCLGDAGDFAATINPEDDSEWCITYDGKAHCYPRKALTEIDDISSSIDNIKGTFRVKTNNFVPTLVEDKESALCIADFGKEMCSEGGSCLKAKRDSTDKDKAAVYDGLTDVLSEEAADVELAGDLSPGDDNYWIDRYFRKEKNVIGLFKPKEAFIETLGVCTYEEQGGLSSLRRTIAGWFGLDPDSIETTIAMIVMAVSIVGILYLMFKKPKRPRPFIPRGLAPPRSPIRKVLPSRLIKRKPIKRKKKGTVTTTKRFF